MEYYKVLGLEPKLSLDLEDLKQRFYGRSRLWHPDRFTRADPIERERALEMTAVLNDAFRTLRNPVTRAEYFLKQNGIELSNNPPPELLEEVFDLNLMLEELREGDHSVRRDLEAARELAVSFPGKCPLFLCMRWPAGEMVFIETHDKYYVEPTQALQQAIDARFGEETYYAKVDTTLPQRAARQWEKKKFNGNGEE